MLTRVGRERRPCRESWRWWVVDREMGRRGSLGRKGLQVKCLRIRSVTSARDRRTVLNGPEKAYL